MKKPLRDKRGHFVKKRPPKKHAPNTAPGARPTSSKKLHAATLPRKKSHPKKSSRRTTPVFTDELAEKIRRRMKKMNAAQKQALNALAAAAAAQHSAIQALIAAAEGEETPKPAPKPKPEPKPAPPEPVKAAPEPAKPATNGHEPDLQAQARKAAKGYAEVYGREGLKEVLKKFTEGTLADIPPEKLPEVIAALT